MQAHFYQPLWISNKANGIYRTVTRTNVNGKDNLSFTSIAHVLKKTGEQLETYQVKRTLTYHTDKQSQIQSDLIKLKYRRQILLTKYVIGRGYSFEVSKITLCG